MNKISETFKKLNKKQWIIIAIASIILIAAIITVVIFVTSKGDSTPANATVASDITSTVPEETESGTGEADSTEASSDDTSETGSASESNPATTPQGNGNGNENPEAPNTGLNISGMSKEQVISVFNSATAKAVNGKAGYQWSRNSVFTEPLNYSYKSTLDDLLSSIGVDVEGVVGGFIGIGSSTASVAKGSAKADNMTDNQNLIKSSLSSADVTSYNATNNAGVNTIKLTLADCTNPKRGENFSIAKVTNDFVVEKDVADALANQDDLPASLKSSAVTLSDINVTATIDANENLTSLKISYNMAATLSLKVSFLSINGDGKAATDISLTNFKY